MSTTEISEVTVSSTVISGAGHRNIYHSSNERRVDSTTHQGQAKIVESCGLLTVKEAAKWLSISPATCYRLMERGALRSIKIGGARRIRVSDLYALIAHEI
jgi:excisionase family DNA binding protein